MNIKYGGRQPRGGAKKCIPLTLSLTIDSSVTVSHLIWLLALCEESQSCVWFGANSKTRALDNPWDQALSVGLTSSRNALITFSGITPNTYWIRFTSAVVLCCLICHTDTALVQSYLNNRPALFWGKFTELAKVACFTFSINVRIVLPPDSFLSWHQQQHFLKSFYENEKPSGLSFTHPILLRTASFGGNCYKTGCFNPKLLSHLRR